MKAIAKDGDEATEQPSSSDDVSSEHGTEQRGQNDDGAASAPPTKRRAVAFAQLQLQPHAGVLVLMLSSSLSNQTTAQHCTALHKPAALQIGQKASRLM